ncbi:hypothetical protein ES703_44613 [subsurface metagenome]
MMANAEWEKVKETLRKPATPEAMRAAAEAFARYRVVQLAKGKGSKPTLVSLGKGKGYPNAVTLDKIPDELARNPNFFNLLKRVVEKEQ